jgi:hypothetical protein
MQVAPGSPVGRFDGLNSCNRMLGVIRWLSKEVEMKKPYIQIIFLVLFVAMFVSCETLALEGNESSTGTSGYSAKQKENPEAKFLGTWVYSDKNFGETAKKLGMKGWPSDSRLELAFSFGLESKGTLSKITSAYGSETEEKQDFIWYIDTFYDNQVWAIMQDNTAERYALLYENELFLTMNDKDVGTLFLARKQQGEIQQ